MKSWCEMKIAILCNGSSDKETDRVELVRQFKEKGHDVYIAGVYTGEINKYYSRENAEFISIEASRRNTNPFVEILSIISVKKKLSEKKIDCVLIYGVKNHAAMAIGAKLGGVKKIVCVVNGSGNLFRIKGIKGTILRFMSFPMLRIAYAISNSVCFQNLDDKKLFKSKHLIKNNDKIFITGGSGVNLDVYQYKRLPKDNRFLFLARITQTKGISEYIRAATIVKQKYPESKFDIVGPLDSVVENSDEDLLKESIADGVVSYHGPTDNVPGWLEKCRYFVYPSYYPEGVPRCAIQAISTGRPIITCETPGCKETVKNKINGFMIPAKNHKVLAEKMIWMIEHPTEVEQMAIESRKYAEEKFDVYKINDLLMTKLLD